MTDADAQTTMSGITDEDLQTIQKLHRAIGGELDLLDEILAPDWRGFPAPDVEVGAEAFKPGVAQFAAAFPDAKITVHEIVASPGRVAIRAEVTGTHTGAWLGVPATGKSCVIAMHAFHHLEGERITRSWPLDDIFGWFQQVKP